MRKPISKRLRFEVFKRDNFTCQYCGAKPPDVVLQIDHIHPVSDGGDNSETNLVTACEHCNQGKSNHPLSVVPRSLEQKTQAIAEREEQLRMMAEIARAAEERLENDAWDAAELIQPGAAAGYSTKRFESIKLFLRRLPPLEVKEAARIAGSKYGLGGRADRFRYFCGICWRKIKDANDGEQ